MLYGGAAGGGKSYFLRWWAAFYLMALADQGIKRATVGLFCEDYPSLLDRQISKIRTEFPPSLGELKEGVTRDFHLSDRYGGGRILLRNLDDPAKYLSAEFAGIAVDELTRNAKTVFDFLRSRLRWPGVSRPQFVAGTNPSGIGHSWVKKLWIESDFPMELKRISKEFYFVPAKSSDNPYLSEEYHKDLETLPPDMAKAYAEGSWDVFAGQYFDIWSPAQMVTPAYEIQLQPWWPRWCSMDWGFKHHAAVYWFAKDDNGRVITYRELHRSGVGEKEWGHLIADNSKGERIGYVFMSPDAFAKRTSQNTVAEEIGEGLVAHGLPRPVAADDDRVGGARLCYQLLVTGNVVISSDCPALIKCLPMLIRDEDKLEDVLKVEGDDPYDAWRYGLKSMLPKGHKPLDVRVEERLAKQQAARVEIGLQPQTDPTMIAMMSKKALAAEKKKDRPVQLITRGRWQRPRFHI